ncbi:Crp/Fnr family transcriptional regulator [uncultured Novosphingobium sp.]|uniref:Crp/Fnr family transcriptional regulator n=1 Tax=uncultured Novosphingobium sp. TaxID=292277 RepID=UPI003747B8CE
MQGQAATVRFASLARLKRDDIRALREMAGPTSRYPAGSFLQVAGSPVSDPMLLLDGWAISSLDVTEGGRQIVKVHMPGDLVGLTSLPFTTCVDTVIALNDVQVCTVSQAAIGKLFHNNARLAALLFLISLEERVMLADRLVMVGRTATSQRIAALILQLRDRMLRSDPSIGLSFRFPLTQLHVADMIGVTTVHVSRIVQELANEGLLKWERGKVTILDIKALQLWVGTTSRELVQEPTWLPLP